ncbi:MAG: hypothetical protein JRJ60_22995 [Deltaproteobacteria bacterium]|nr:hypothetical protein [Deltaproteobacteria bacterium]
MATSSSKKSLRKRSSGKQHRLDIKLSDTLADGALDFYSNQFTLHLDLKKSKLTGTAIVSGDNHSLKIGLKKNNCWDLAYNHKYRGREMSLLAEYGTVNKSENLFGVIQKSKHHDIKLAYQEKLGLFGYVKGRTRYLDYGLHFTRGKTSSFEVKHSGSHHDLKLKFFPDGSYELNAKIKVSDGELIVSKRKNRLEAEIRVPF